MIEDYKTNKMLLSYLNRRIKELEQQKEELGQRSKSKFDKYDLTLGELEFIQDWLLEIEAKNEF